MKFSIRSQETLSKPRDDQGMKSNRTPLKVTAGFILGAVIAGSVATAATNSVVSSVVVCADNRTQVLTLAKAGVCATNKTAIEIGSNSINAKSISALVTPSVVSISVKATAGSGTGSGSIYKTNATSSFIITNNHVIESAVTSALSKWNLLMEQNFQQQLLVAIVGMTSRFSPLKKAICQPSH